MFFLEPGSTDTGDTGTKVTGVRPFSKYPTPCRHINVSPDLKTDYMDGNETLS